MRTGLSFYIPQKTNTSNYSLNMNQQTSTQISGESIQSQKVAHKKSKLLAFLEALLAILIILCAAATYLSLRIMTRKRFRTDVDEPLETLGTGPF